jgi:hypothetical protein
VNCGFSPAFWLLVAHGATFASVALAGLAAARFFRVYQTSSKRKSTISMMECDLNNIQGGTALPSPLSGLFIRH